MTLSSSTNQPDNSGDSGLRANVRARLRTMPGYLPVRRAVWQLAYWTRQYIAWPPFYLLWVLPRTYYRLWHDVLCPSDHPDDPILSYAYNNATNILWYFRVAQDMLKYGPQGYVYGDAFGTALGDRFFLHPLSYGFLFGKLRPRRYALLAGTILLGSILSMGILSGNAGGGFMLALLAAGSPALIMSLFHLSKPENLGWAFLPMVVFLTAKGETIPAAVGLLIISITSITMLLPAVLTLGILWVTGLLPLASCIWIGLPSGIIIGWQLVRFFSRMGLRQFFEIIGGSGKHQTMKSADTLQYLRVIVPAHKAWSALQVALAMAAAAAGAPLGHVLVLLSPVILLVLNYRGFRWADHSTFGRIFLAFDLTYALLYPSPIYFVALLIMLLAVHPRLVMEAGGLDMNFVPTGEHLSSYPYTSRPVHLGKEAARVLQELFAQVPDGSRVAWEAVAPFDIFMGGFRHSYLLIEWLLAQRQIEALPSFWLRATQTDWYIHRYACLGQSSSVEECTTICQEGGIQYLLVSTDKLRSRLSQAGYSVLGHATLETFQQTCLGSLMNPPTDLYLLKVPAIATLIEPLVELKRQRSQMVFYGQSGASYFIKYNYHASWVCHVNGQAVPVQAGHWNKYLKGMEVTIPTSGIVTLEFKSGWLR